MEIQKVPLLERLEAVSRRNPAHAEYVPALLRAFAAQPIAVYLSEYPQDLERLAELVRYPVSQMPELAYSEAIIRIQDMRRIGISTEEALEILAKPMIGLYRKHLERSDPNA